MASSLRTSPLIETIGIVGAGQLAQMMLPAAEKLGKNVRVWAKSNYEPASRMLAPSQIFGGEFHNEKDLDEFCNGVDVITIESENTPISMLEHFERNGKIVRPSSRALEITSDRLFEKQFIEGLGLSVAPYHAITLGESLPRLGDFFFPGILKTRRLGYDGHGQITIQSAADIPHAFARLDVHPCVIEEKQKLLCEFSIIVVRDALGFIGTYPAIQNVHKDGILQYSMFPGRDVPPAIEGKAQEWAMRIAQGLGTVGVLTVEFFYTINGRLLVNEIAPRVHNSGHGTIEACRVSQFEQHIRVICGMPLKDMRPSSCWIMDNCLTETQGQARAKARELGGILHWYGKPDPLPNEPPTIRKRGHITRIYPYSQKRRVLSYRP